MGRPLSVFRPRLCLVFALVAAAPFYHLAVPVGCACWPCLLSVPLVRARGGGTFLSFGRACCLCLLAMSVVCVCCPRSWRRHPGFHRRGGTPASTSAAIPRVPPARRHPGFHQRGDPSGGTSRRRAGRSSGSAVPNLIEQGCDAHHDMRTPAPLGHPALFGCASVCPCFALRHQLRRRLRFTSKSSGRNSQRGSTSAPGSHAQ